MMTIIHYIAVSILLLSAASYDSVKHKIPNFLTMPFMLIGGAINMSCYGLDGIKVSIAGLVIPAVLLILFAFQMLGAGDIKLFMGIGAILGGKLCIYSMALSFLVGGILAFFLLIIRKNGKKRLNKLFRYIWVSIGIRKFEPYDTIDAANDGYFSFGLCISIGTAGVMILDYYELLTIIFGGSF